MPGASWSCPGLRLPPPSQSSDLLSELMPRHLVLQGTTYQKTDAAVEMKRINREQFWEQAKKEEELRKEEERKKALDERLRFEQERMEQERQEQEERERRYREREQQIEEHRWASTAPPQAAPRPAGPLGPVLRAARRLIFAGGNSRL